MSMDQLAQPNQKKPWHGITPGARFADGGAVDDDVAGAIPDDNSGAAPVAQADSAPAIPDDNSGAAPVVAPQPQAPQEPQSRSGLDFNAAHVPGNAQKIIAYLMGGPAGGGADQETAEKFARPDKHKGASDDDANLIAVQKAFELGGPQAAWAMVQFNRGAYNAKSSFAKAAITGHMGKAPDINAAADAATKASAHMLDGSAVHYRPSLSGGDNGQPGVIATVKIPGTSQEQEFALSTQQFAQAVDPMGEGQYDKVLERGGMPALLARIAKAKDDAAEARIGGNEKANADFQAEHPAPDSEAVRTGKPIAKDVTEGDQPAIPGTHDDHGHYLGPKSDDDAGNYGEELQRRSRGVFPGYNLANEGARHQWMNEQEEKQLERDTKIGVAAEKGKNDIEKARVTGIGKMGAADISGVHRENAAGTTAEARKYGADARGRSEAVKAAIRLGEIASRSKDRAQHEAAATLRGKLLNPMTPLTPQEEAQVGELLQAGRPSTPAPAIPQGATPQATPPQGAPPRPSNVPAGAKFYKGSWYTRGPNGESVPVQ